MVSVFTRTELCSFVVCDATSPDLADEIARHVAHVIRALEVRFFRSPCAQLATLSAASAGEQAAAARILGNGNNRVTFGRLHPVT